MKARFHQNVAKARAHVGRIPAKSCSSKIQTYFQSPRRVSDTLITILCGPQASEAGTRRSYTNGESRCCRACSIKIEIAHCACTYWDLCFCADHSRLNAVTVRDSYPIPRMEECRESFGKERIFPSLDANSRYWKAEVGEKVVDKTAFAANNGLPKYAGWPFRLKHAPATFYRAINVVLSTET